MKYVKILLIVSFFFFISCDDSENSTTEYKSTAIISGYDLTLCACCGGWIITMDGETESLRFTDLPQDSEIDLDTANFPISVKLNWEESYEYCGNGIVIEEIELID